MAESPKNKGGRPPKAESEVRDRTIRFRVNPAEYGAVKERARRGSLTLSEYARQMVLTGKAAAPASPEELRLVAELTREKNNLNQLAKAQNAAGAGAREAELMRIIRFYNRVIAKLKKSGV